MTRSSVACRVVVAIVVCGAAAGCAGVGRGTDGPARIRGRVLADRIPADARIEVYRADGEGPAVLVPGVEARPDELGRFETGSLPPGRYVVALRTRDAQASTGTADVPTRTDVEMRLASPGQGATIVLESPRGAESVRRVRVTPDAPARSVADRREVSIHPGGEARISGLEPGVWHLDVFPDGATADFVVPPGEAVQRWIVDPPAAPGLGGRLEGVVLRLRGEPAEGAVVTVRVSDSDGTTISPWGRIGVVGRDGRYEVTRLAPGTAYVRVESRDASFLRLPPSELIRISPSGASERGFTVEP